MSFNVYFVLLVDWHMLIMCFTCAAICQVTSSFVLFFFILFFLELKKVLLLPKQNLVNE